MLEGLFMWVFGTSVLTPVILVGIFAAVACAYVFRLVTHTDNTQTAVVATLLFGFSPLVFRLSQHVMLEIPALAFSMAAIYHILRYLEESQRRDLALGALAVTLACLTRFDGIYLLCFFAIMLYAWRKLAVLKKKEVLFSLAFSIVAILPFYALTMMEFGEAHVAIRQTLGSSAERLVAFRDLLYYPLAVPQQIGWFALIPAVIGLAGSMRAGRRAQVWPYVALVVSVCVTFTLLGELDSRHTIYWIPAFAYFASEGVHMMADRTGIKGMRIALVFLVVGGTAWTSGAKAAW